MIEAFPIVALMPMLTFLIGCGVKYPIDWSTAFYKPEATQAKFVMDYQECDQSAGTKGMLKSGVPVDRSVTYEWLEKDRVNIILTYYAHAEYAITAYEKRKIFISEYGPLLNKCMEEKGWIRKDYRQGDGPIYFIYLSK